MDAQCVYRVSVIDITHNNTLILTICHKVANSFFLHINKNAQHNGDISDAGIMHKILVSLLLTIVLLVAVFAAPMPVNFGTFNTI